jgi:hypothetical protein
MSNYLAIATVTAALKQLLLMGLQSATWGFPYDLTVTAAPPDVARSGFEALGQINLYLYHAGANTAWRNEPPPRQVKQGESGLPSLALDLRYLITAYAPDHNDVEVHRLLGRALSVLHDHSVLGAAELAAALVHSDVHEQLERIRLIPLVVSVEEMANLWNSFQKPYNLSVAWQVSVVLIESARSARTPLPVLIRASTGLNGGDTALVVTPEIGPVTPGIESVAPPAQQISARLGDALEIGGHLLAGAQVRIAVAHSRWSTTRYLVPASITASRVSVALPSGGGAETDWPAGTYALSVGVTRQLGGAELVTNELPFALAPTLMAISPTSGTPDANGILPVTVHVSPPVWVGQRVWLIAGDRTFAPQAFTAQTDTLQFALKGLAPRNYRLRLRVDGVDSLVVDKTTTPPSFVGPELEVL